MDTKQTGLVLAIALLAGACSSPSNGKNGATGPAGDAGANGAVSLVVTTSFAAGQGTSAENMNCPNGGVRIESGIDNGANGGTANDGILEAGEVTSTSYVCNGAVGPSGDAGLNGANGSDGDAGANGFNALVTTTAFAAGQGDPTDNANCPNGGVRIDSGLDNGAGGGTANDGILEPGEITSSQDVCNGAPALTWTIINSNTQALPNQGYIVENTNTAQVTLPQSSTLNAGDIVRVDGSNGSGFSIAQQGDQSIWFGSSAKGMPGANWQSVGPAINWTAVAAGTSGTAIAAVNPGQLFVSNDSGITWLAVEQIRNWSAVATSSDGTYLIAADGYGPGGYLYISTNSGATWTQRATKRNWASVASSSDGSRMLATANDGTEPILSTDHGTTWNSVGPVGVTATYAAVAMSGDGTYMVAATNSASGGLIFGSNDSGSSWSSLSAPLDSSGNAENWLSLAMNETAQVGAYDVVAGASKDLFAGYVFTPQNQALTANWKRGPASQGEIGWTSVAVEASGQNMAAQDAYQSIYLSTDQGNSWTAANNISGTNCIALAPDDSVFIAMESNGYYATAPSMTGTFQQQYVNFTAGWNHIAASADGTHLIAADTGPQGNGGQLWTSADSGQTWIAQWAVAGAWTGVAISPSADVLLAAVDTTIYSSYDFGTTWTAQITQQGNLWSAVAISRYEGVATAADNPIYASNANGAAWAPYVPNTNPSPSLNTWSAIAVSDTGVIIAADSGGSGQIYLATHLLDFAPVKGLPGAVWDAVAISADGTKMMAASIGNSQVAGQGNVYYSSDSGATWTQELDTETWESVAISADGSTLSAAAENGSIWLSVDAGQNWTTEQAGSLNWRSLALSADGRDLYATTIGSGTTTPVYLSYGPTNATTQGAPDGNGAIVGDPGASIELIYAGNGIFNALSSEGPLFAY